MAFAMGVEIEYKIPNSGEGWRRFSTQVYDLEDLENYIQHPSFQVFRIKPDDAV